MNECFMVRIDSYEIRKFAVEALVKKTWRMMIEFFLLVVAAVVVAITLDNSGGSRDGDRQQGR